MEDIRAQRSNLFSDQICKAFGRMPGEVRNVVDVHNEKTLVALLEKFKRNPLPGLVGLDVEGVNYDTPYVALKAQNKINAKFRLGDPAASSSAGPFARLIQFAFVDGDVYILDTFKFQHLSTRLIAQLCDETAVVAAFHFDSDHLMIDRVYGETDSPITVQRALGNYLDARKSRRRQPTILKKAQYFDCELKFKRLKSEDQALMNLKRFSLKEFVKHAFDVSINKSQQPQGRMLEQEYVSQSLKEYAALDALLHLDLFLFFVCMEFFNKGRRILTIIERSGLKTFSQLGCREAPCGKIDSRENQSVATATHDDLAEIGEIKRRKIDSYDEKSTAATTGDVLACVLHRTPPSHHNLLTVNVETQNNLATGIEFESKPKRISKDVAQQVQSDASLFNKLWQRLGSQKTRGQWNIFVSQIVDQLKIRYVESMRNSHQSARASEWLEKLIQNVLNQELSSSIHLPSDPLAHDSSLFEKIWNRAFRRKSPQQWNTFADDTFLMFKNIYERSNVTQSMADELKSLMERTVARTTKFQYAKRARQLDSKKSFGFKTRLAARFVKCNEKKTKRPLK